jgi:hypothetical protein
VHVGLLDARVAAQRLLEKPPRLVSLATPLLIRLVDSPLTSLRMSVISLRWMVMNAFPFKALTQLTGNQFPPLRTGLLEARSPFVWFDRTIGGGPECTYLRASKDIGKQRAIWRCQNN